MLQRAASNGGNTWTEAMTVTLVVQGSYSPDDALAIVRFKQKYAWMLWDGALAYTSDISRKNASFCAFSSNSLDSLQQEALGRVRELVLAFNGRADVPASHMVQEKKPRTDSAEVAQADSEGGQSVKAGNPYAEGIDFQVLPTLSWQLSPFSKQVVDPVVCSEDLGQLLQERLQVVFSTIASSLTRVKAACIEKAKEKRCVEMADKAIKVSKLMTVQEWCPDITSTDVFVNKECTTKFFEALQTWLRGLEEFDEDTSELASCLAPFVHLSGGEHLLHQYCPKLYVPEAGEAVRDLRQTLLARKGMKRKEQEANGVETIRRVVARRSSEIQEQLSKAWDTLADDNGCHVIKELTHSLKVLDTYDAHRLQDALQSGANRQSLMVGFSMILTPEQLQDVESVLQSSEIEEQKYA